MKILKKVIMFSIALVVLFSGCVSKDGITPTPTSTPEQTVNKTEQKIADLAKQDLAITLKISVDKIILTNIEEVTWRDSSLGYPAPDMQYLTVITPGYKILLTYGNRTYEYHSDYERVVPPPAQMKEK